jgi:hypothetical protein
VQKEKIMPNYIEPHLVVSPRNMIRNVRPIYDGGLEHQSAALIDWDGVEHLGLRWNGHEREDGKPSIGMPSSKGFPTWFLVERVDTADKLKSLLSLGKFGGHSIDQASAYNMLRHAIDRFDRNGADTKQLDRSDHLALGPVDIEQVPDQFKAKVLTAIRELQYEGELNLDLGPKTLMVTINGTTMEIPNTCHQSHGA